MYAAEGPYPGTRLAEIVSPDFLFERAVYDAAADDGRDAEAAHQCLRELVEHVHSGALAEWLDPALAAFAERDYARAEREAIAAAAACDHAGDGTPPLLQLIGDAGGVLHASIVRQRAALLLAGDAQWLQLKYWDAEQSYRVASRLVSKTDPAAWLEVQRRVSQLLEQAGKAEAALRRREEIAATCAARWGPEDRQTLAAQSWVAWSLEVLEKPQEAEQRLQQIFARRVQRFGPQDRDVACSLHEIGRLHTARGFTVWAVPPAAAALDLRRRVLAPNHPAILQSLREMALASRACGDLARAEACFREALAGSERLFGPQHGETATHARALADFLGGAKRAAEAEPLYRRVLAIHARGRGPGDDAGDLLEERRTFDSFLLELNKPPELERFLRERLAAGERELGPEQPAVARSLVALAEWLYAEFTPAWAGVIPGLVEPVPANAALAAPSDPAADRGLGDPRAQEALALFRRALAMCDRLLGDEPDAVPDLPQRITLLRAQASSLQHLDSLVDDSVAEADHLVYRWTESSARLLKAEVDREESLRGPVHPDVADRLESYADFVAGWKKPAEADPLYARVFEIRERALDLESDQLFRAYFTVALSCEARGELAEAVALTRRLLARPDAQHIAHPQTEVPLCTQLATLLYKLGRPAEAEPPLRRVQALEEKAKVSLVLEGGRYDPNALTLANFLRMEGRPAEALPLYRRKVAEDSREWPIEGLRVKLVEVLGDVGEFAEAEALLHAEMEAHENQAMLVATLGVLRAQQGRYAEARTLIAPVMVPSVPPDEPPPAGPRVRRHAGEFQGQAERPHVPAPATLAEYLHKLEMLQPLPRFAKYLAESEAALAQEAAAIPPKPGVASRNK